MGRTPTRKVSRRRQNAIDHATGSQRLIYEVDNLKQFEQPLSATSLTGYKDIVRRVMVFTDHKLVVAVYYDSDIRFYDIDSAGDDMKVRWRVSSTWKATS